MRILLAPMEGVVDYVMRRLLTEIGGIDYCTTEFIRVSDRLLPKKEFYRYCPELFHGAKTLSGIPVLCQLLGGDPKLLAENAAYAAALGFPGIDLNFGCPAKTVNKHDGGASLLKNPSRIFTVVSEVRKAVPHALPVTAKVRLGFHDKSQAIEIAQAAEAGGAHWLTVHARTRDERYLPPAHWEWLEKIRTSIHIPVIANGDIWNFKDHLQCLSVSGCQDFMLGRGIIALPDLARQIKYSQQVPKMGWKEILPLIPRFFKMSQDFRTDRYATNRTKQWTKLLARNFPESETLFQQIKRVTDAELVYQIVQQFPQGVVQPAACPQVGSLSA